MNNKATATTTSLQVWADVLVASAQRFRESSAVPGTLHHSIAKEGKVLYGSLG